MDGRMRSQMSLSPTTLVTGAAQGKHVQQAVLSGAVTACALSVGRQWLLHQDLSVFWVLLRVLACGGLGVLGWAGWTGQLKTVRRKSVEWSILGVASLAFLVQQASLLTALFRLSPLRVVALTHAYSLMPRCLSSSRPTNRWLAVGTALTLSLISDVDWDSGNVTPFGIAYLCILAHAVSTWALEHTQGVLTPSLGGDTAMAVTTLGAACLGLPLYGFRRALLEHTPRADIPLTSLSAIPVLAYALIFLAPSVNRSLQSISSPASVLKVSFPSSVAVVALVGFLTSSSSFGATDLAVGGLMYYGMSSELLLGVTSSRTPTSRLIRTYMKTILANPESRKIFYFLVLNLVYMFVQMLYGVWTNSLGLISDAIHMAFDCMAIGVGLLASVMATWDPNERFTYGYGRIETLSGFANGIFLILISIFIIFEAIERLLDPPEMETSQLLLVSSVGLGVNLFGLFAMGGHHHHGHSHSHGHSHGGDSHAQSPSGNSHGHSHAASQSHSHSEDSHNHSHAPAVAATPSVVVHSHQGYAEVDHGHSHAGDVHNHGHHSHDEHSHSHDGHASDDDHGHEHGHSHSHDDAEDHGHSHDHSHSHDHAHSHDLGHSQDHVHSQDHGHSHDSHSHSGQANAQQGLTMPSAPPGRRPGPGKRQFSGPALQIPNADGTLNVPKSSALAQTLLNQHGGAALSPITPSYTFTHDEHYERHHNAESAPNLHAPAHAHAHEHEGHSDNMRGVFLHVLADTMGSVGVIISTLLIKFYGWTGFDPIASLFIAILIVASVVPLVIDTGKILCLDVSSRSSRIDGAMAEVSAVPGVASYERARFWPKDGNSLVGSLVIRLEHAPGSVDPTGPHSSAKSTYASVDRVVGRVDAVLRQHIRGLEELTIQVNGD